MNKVLPGRPLRANGTLSLGKQISDCHSHIKQSFGGTFRLIFFGLVWHFSSCQDVSRDVSGTDHLVELGVVPQLLAAEGHVPRQLVGVPGQGPRRLQCLSIDLRNNNQSKRQRCDVPHNTKELNAVHALPGGDMLMSRRGP